MRARRRGGALVGGSVAAGRWQRAAGGLTGPTGRVPGNAVGGGAHPSGGTMKMRWRMLQAVAFIVGEGAPISGEDGGTTLQCRRRRGEVIAASNGDNGGRWEVSP
jgi:hypothetical protein